MYRRLLVATLLLSSACDDGSTSELLGSGEGRGEDRGTLSESNTGGVPTNSPDGKSFYTKNVHPFMAQKCGACHGTAGPGPAWLTSADAEKSYTQLFQVGYVVKQSRIVMKPVHGGSTTNVLGASEAKTYEQWVAMELKDGGKKAPPKILEKLGSCFDREKFDAMKMGQWLTSRRKGEDPTTCTGCALSPCSTCHSSDPATNYKNGVGNKLIDEDETFEESKLTNPAYITKYFGVSPEGKPVPSNAIKKKAESTQLTKPYSHPMYELKEEHEAALDDFVDDVITKWNAGACGK